jgi:hypothetical protein
MIFSFLCGQIHPTQEGRSQKITPDYAEPAPSVTALTSTLASYSA